MQKVLFVVNNPAFFLSHRLNVALAAKEHGYSVAIAGMDGPDVPYIESLGFKYFVVPMSRSGMNPLHELITLSALYKLFKSFWPDVVHLVTIKPVVYGGLAARLAKVPAVVYAISGLGYMFSSEKQGLDLAGKVVRVLYKLGLEHKNSRVIVQNKDDQELLQSFGAIKPEQVVLIRGSGANIEQYKFSAEPDKPIVITMAARLLKDKGVLEFVDAARMSKQQNKDYIWQLAGSVDQGNPASFTKEQTEQWKDAVCVLGQTSNIVEVYAQSHIVVLPSYREGLPKSLVEAAACGRAVVTTNVPGCRDAIEDNITGLLVPAKNSQALYAAIDRLAMDDNWRLRMGEKGRELAEREFDERVIAKRQVALYQELLAEQKSN